MRCLIIALLLGALSAGCSFTAGQPVVVDEFDTQNYIVSEEFVDLTVSPAIAADFEEGESDGSEYLLGPGDVLSLNVWKTPELGGEFKLGPDGMISIPLFGAVKLEGMSRAEAAEVIRKMVFTAYFDPKVSVNVAQYNNNNIYVLGEVRGAGVYKIEGRATLLQVLTMAGGPLATADMEGCTVIRGDRCLFRIDLNDLLKQGNTSLNIPLKANDTIYVPDNSMKSVYVLGEVNNAMMVPVGRGLDLLRALTQAGSMTEDAVMTDVKIIRRHNGRVKIITVDVKRIFDEAMIGANIPLQANDIVYVPEKGIAKFNYVLRQFSPSLSMVFLVDQLQNIGQ